MNARSWLCAPSTKSRLVCTSTEVGADISLLDLEDSVPECQKDQARNALLESLMSQPLAQIAIRLNSLSTVNGLKDILFLLEHDLLPGAIILPKARVPADIELAANLLKAKKPQVKLFVVVESVKALWEFRHLHMPPERLKGLIFGSADFCADLGIDVEIADLSFVKAEIVLMAKRFGLLAIDAPCFHVKDTARLEQELGHARRLGFNGKIAIHPAQVPIINDFFTPTSHELKRAQVALDLIDQNQKEPVIQLEGELLGPPFRKYAQWLLSMQSQLERKDSSDSR